MYIKEMFKLKKPVISFEIFPPNKETKVKSIYSTIDKLANIEPDFMSVTYGASGSKKTKDLTLELASYVKNKVGIESLAHLTCIDASRNEITNILKTARDLGIENILALRGDKPECFKERENQPYKFASDLILEIKRDHKFSVGAACHPEGHTESKSKVLDLINLKKKVDSGADFLVSQLFFNNNDFYSFAKEVRLLGINVPIIAGIMPVVNAKQVEKIVSLCGASVPEKFSKILRKYHNNKEALVDAGIAYASDQIIDLLSSGIDGVHIYAMNRPEIAKRLVSNISSVVRCLNLERSEISAG